MHKAIRSYYYFQSLSKEIGFLLSHFGEISITIFYIFNASILFNLHCHLSYKWPCSILDYPLCHLKFRTVLGWQRYSLQSINVGRLKSFVSILSYVKPYTISGNVSPASCWKILRLSNMNFRLKSFFRTFWFFSYQNFPVARWFLWLHEVTVWFNFTVFGILITSRPKLQFKVNIILNFYNVVLNWLWPAICLCWKKI